MLPAAFIVKDLAKTGPGFSVAHLNNNLTLTGFSSFKTGIHSKMTPSDYSI